MTLYVTKWPASIYVAKDKLVISNDLHQGFVELYHDGKASSLRIFYVNDEEERLEKECVQITDLERAEDSNSLTFRICTLKSGLDCNDHVFIKPERSKDCHTIFYAFRCFQKKTSEATNSSVQPLRATRKQKLSKRVPSFQQISVSSQAYDDRRMMEGMDLVKVASSMKSGSLKKKVVFSNVVVQNSSAMQHSRESVGECKTPEIDAISMKSGSLKKKTASVDNALFRISNKQNSTGLSSTFERLSAGADPNLPEGFLNLGNSCYMNAVLQGLFHVEAFEELLNSFPESPERKECILLNALRTLREEYQNAGTEKKRVLLEEVFKNLSDKHSDITEQKDAQEFLTLMFNKIDSELCALTSSAGTGENGLSKSMLSLSSIFGYAIQHRIDCMKCGGEEESIEEGTFLGLQITRDVSTGPPSLQMLLDNGLKSEEVDHICEHCSGNSATMSHKYLRLPKYLIIFLKRYEFTQSEAKKEGKKRKDVVELSMRIQLIQFNDERREVEQLYSGSDADDVENESVVFETPLGSNRFSSSGNESEDVEGPAQRMEANAVNSYLFENQRNENCGDGRRMVSKVAGNPRMNSVAAYDFNANKRLKYFTLFCQPGVNFCKRACALLNIHRRRSTRRQQPKPLFQNSTPSSIARITGDGNCLFRSVAYSLAGCDDEHHAVRRSVVEFEKKFGNHLRELQRFSKADWEEHVNKMASDGEWGTETELLALAALLDVEIWTFLDGRWLRYRPLFKIEVDGTAHSIPIKDYEGSKKDAIFLVNEDLHYQPVLDISTDEVRFGYQLIAVISHKGSTAKSGHYVCDVRNKKKNVWVHFDDACVEEKPEAKILSGCSTDGYIFFYVAES